MTDTEFLGLTTNQLAKIASDLKAENEKLRDKNMLLAVDKRGIKACYDNLSEQYKELEEENAKLRELVRNMFEEIEDSGFDPLVERQGKRGSYYEEDPSWRVGIRERVRELRIEEEQ